MVVMMGLCIQFNALVHGDHYTGGSMSISKINLLHRIRSFSRISDCVRDANTADVNRPSGWIAEWSEIKAAPSKKRSIMTVVPEYTAHRVWHTPLTQLLKTTRTDLAPWWPGGPVSSIKEQIEYRARNANP